MIRSLATAAGGEITDNAIRMETLHVEAIFELAAMISPLSCAASSRAKEPYHAFAAGSKHCSQTRLRDRMCGVDQALCNVVHAR
jgi:hypothetical protein